MFLFMSCFCFKFNFVNLCESFSFLIVKYLACSLCLLNFGLALTYFAFDLNTFAWLSAWTRNDPDPPPGLEFLTLCFLAFYDHLLICHHETFASLMLPLVDHLTVLLVINGRNFQTQVFRFSVQLNFYFRFHIILFPIPAGYILHLCRHLCTFVQ